MIRKQHVNNALQSEVLSYKKATNNQHMRIYFAVSISMSTVIRIFFACLYWNASKAIHGKLFVYVIMTDYISIYALWKIYIYAKNPLV